MNKLATSVLTISSAPPSSVVVGEQDYNAVGHLASLLLGLGRTLFENPASGIDGGILDRALIVRFCHHAKWSLQAEDIFRTKPHAR
jgi:hypothetical protein